MDKRTKRVVGNCPRCGMPIYEAKGEPKKSCRCLPLADAPTPWVPAPYYPPYPYQWPWRWPYATWVGGTANVPSVWVGGPSGTDSVTVSTYCGTEYNGTTVTNIPGVPFTYT